MPYVVYFASYDAVPEFTARVAIILGGRVTHRADGSELRLDAAALVSGATGDRRAAVLRPDPQWPYALPGDYRAIDAYGIELRLWPSSAPGSDADIAAGVFDRLCDQLPWPMLLTLDERLVAACHPDLGPRNYDGVSVLAADRRRWGPYVLDSPAMARDQDNGDTVEEARARLSQDLHAVAGEVCPDGVPVVEFNQGPLDGSTGPVDWAIRVAVASSDRPWDAGELMDRAVDALDARGWDVGQAHLDGRSWFADATREGHRLVVEASRDDGILRLHGLTPRYRRQH